MSDQADRRATLKILSALAQDGASEGTILRLLCDEPLISFAEVGGGSVHVKVGRVDRIEPAAGDRTRMYFTQAPDAHPMADQRPVLLEREWYRVRRDLLDAGWEERT